MMTRKDYRIIANAIVELYYDEAQEFESTQHAANAQHTIARHLKSIYHNFDLRIWNAYIERLVSENKESR